MSNTEEANKITFLERVKIRLQGIFLLKLFFPVPEFEPESEPLSKEQLSVLKKFGENTGFELILDDLSDGRVKGGLTNSLTPDIQLKKIRLTYRNDEQTNGSILATFIKKILPTTEILELRLGEVNNFNLLALALQEKKTLKELRIEIRGCFRDGTRVINGERDSVHSYSYIKKPSPLALDQVTALTIAINSMALKTLSLLGFALNNDAAKKIAQAITKAHTLKQVFVEKNNHMERNGMLALAKAVGQHSEVEHFSFSSNDHLTPEIALEMLEELMKNKKLTYINICPNEATWRRGWTDPKEMREHGTEKEESDEFKWGAIKNIISEIEERNRAELATCARIAAAKTLDLGGYGLNDDAANKIAQAITKAHMLKEVYVEKDNHMKKEGMLALAKAVGQHPEIYCFSFLNNDHLTPEIALKMLEELENNKKLTYIDIRCTHEVGGLNIKWFLVEARICEIEKNNRAELAKRVPIATVEEAAAKELIPVTAPKPSDPVATLTTSPTEAITIPAPTTTSPIDQSDLSAPAIEEHSKPLHQSLSTILGTLKSFAADCANNTWLSACLEQFRHAVSSLLTSFTVSKPTAAKTELQQFPPSVVNSNEKPYVG